jgi:YHS domain-containing protein
VPRLLVRSRRIVIPRGGIMPSGRTSDVNAERSASMDPVCGMSVDPASAAGAWPHAGRTYYFCSTRCLQRFKADPQHFVDVDPNERSMG